MINRINSKYLRLVRKYIIDLLISKKSILNGLNFPIDGRILKKNPVCKKLVPITKNIHIMIEYENGILSKRNQKALNNSYNHI